MLGALHRAWARLWGAVRPETSDEDFVDELSAHLDLAVGDLIAQGHSPGEARRIARVQLGNVSLLREDRRGQLGLPWLGTFWLDIKLGLRMLRKSWGLTLIGGLAMAITIAVALVAFWALETLFAPTLPLEDGERIVALQTWDQPNAVRHATTMQDFERWREQLTTADQVSAYRAVPEALNAGTEHAVSLRGAQITASGLRLPRVEPTVGRLLTADDESPSADPVAVISHGLWQNKLAGDPAVLGSTLRLLGGTHTVVGVMPQGFAFPLNHEIWTPLRSDQRQPLPTVGPEAVVFARRSAGASLAQLQAEISSLGVLEPNPPQPDSERTALSETRTEPSQLIARAVPYTLALTGDLESGKTAWILRLVLLLLAMLLVPPCANIAILVYARIVSRQQEFASRLALGASRTRIVSQIFLEVLVLSLAAAALATGSTAVLVRVLGQSVIQSQGGQLPFWIDFSLSPRAFVFAVALAVVAALIAGVLPAMQATRHSSSAGLIRLGDRTAMKLGPTWSILVVGQVALTLAALPASIEMAWGTLRDGVLGPGFPAQNYVLAEARLDPLRIEQAPDDPSREVAAQRRFSQLQTQLTNELRSRPGIAAVTNAAWAPGDEPWALLTTSRESAAGTSHDRAEHTGTGPTSDDPSLVQRHLARFNSVGPGYFEALAQPLLIGRSFEAGDFGTAARPVVVSQTFADKMFGGRSALGETLHYLRGSGGEPLTAQQQSEHQIVGVVADRPNDLFNGTVYHPSQPGSYAGATILLHSPTGGTGELVDDVRELITALHPGMVVDQTKTLATLYREQQQGNNVGALALAVVTLSVLLLSAAGIYALTSFTIRQRRREIGIRAALGAQPVRLLRGVFRRVLIQIGAGAGLGCGIALVIGYYLPIERLGGSAIPAIVPVSAALMALVGALAAAGPARRGLQLDPIEELRQG